MNQIGPGPAEYLLPSALGCKNHDPRKEKLPCYTIGSRFQLRKDKISPGPANYTIENCTRFGCDNKSGGYIGGKKLQQKSHIATSSSYSTLKRGVSQEKSSSNIARERYEKYDKSIPAFRVHKITKISNSKRNSRETNYLPIHQRIIYFLNQMFIEYNFK